MTNAEFYKHKTLEEVLFEYHTAPIDTKAISLIDWLGMKHGEVLDKVEKKYLRNLVLPFYDDVRYIYKEVWNGTCRVFIELHDGSLVKLPRFDADKPMYLGMKAGLDYTLADLNIKKRGGFCG
jgi:hypothetical protein